MKSGFLPLSSFVAVLVAAPLVASPALAEPRHAQSESSAGSDEVRAPAEDSTWFEGERAESPSAPADAQPTNEKTEPKAPVSRAAERSTGSARLIVVDRGTTDMPRRSDPSWRRHDGFYLRMSMGVGGLGARTTGQDSEVGFEAGSGSSAFDFMLGGTPTPGFTLGGGFQLDLGHQDPERSEQIDGEHRAAGRSAFALAGPFIDVFPNPRGGFHFGGMLGGAALAHSASVDAEPETFRGVGGSLWLGYQWWVARQWSLGAMLRGTSARLQSTDAFAAEEAEAGSVALLFTVLYH